MTYFKDLPNGDRIEAVVVNGIVYRVMSRVDDHQGVLFCIRRPTGRKCYAARPILDTTYGACRAYIVCNL